MLDVILGDEFDMKNAKYFYLGKLQMHILSKFTKRCIIYRTLIYWMHHLGDVAYYL